MLFSFPSRYLVRYRSRDVFSLGGTCPPSSHPQTRGWYSALAQAPGKPLAYGAVTLYGPPFQGSSARPPGSPGSAHRQGKTPHLPRPYGPGIWFGLSPFRSPLLGGSRLISSPPPTKMFPFGGFPPLTGRRSLLGSARNSHSGIPGSTGACPYPGHIAACRALRRRPSRAIHREAYAPGDP